MQRTAASLFDQSWMLRDITDLFGYKLYGHFFVIFMSKNYLGSRMHEPGGLPIS